ncbi:DCC1-like thiol-disulfide oxidoreductase family protein [Hydrocarboniphaga sp.]|uniref:DCC1-like thiol-disulfide oxidoreductase family protein n=1 Tax=Hydrocarboniphaga sp. TaxID=2033016 RepID=UPI003D12C75C
MNPNPRFWTDSLGRAFALDLRSLAAMRFALGLLLLIDTLSRLGEVGAFYGDAGVLPRALQAGVASPWRWSLHLANGEAWFQSLLLLAQALAALLLAFGWRTRVVTLIAWLLTASLLNRNPLVIGAGDVLLCLLLFWSLFLPMAARWSVDAALSPQPPPDDHRHASWASAALLLQLLSVFVFQALLQPTAANLYAADTEVLAAGRWLRQHLAANEAITSWALTVQLVSPLILLLRAGSTRIARLRIVVRAVLLLQLLLVALLTMFTLRCGVLPWAQIVGLIALVGATFWENRALRLRRQNSGGELRIYYDRGCGFCLKSCRLLTQMLVLPHAKVLPAQDHRRADSLLRANDSWVVIDHDDTAFLKGAAMLLLIKRSPLFSWLGRLALRLGFSAAADLAYEVVARNRPAFARVTDKLIPERALRFVPSPGVQRIAGVLATLVLLWNLAGLRTPAGPFEKLLAPPLQLLRLDQHWDRYSPSPTPADSWWVAAGHLGDGREVDALRGADDALRFDEPAAIRDDGLHWRAFRRQMAQPEAAAVRARWADYLCERWNDGRSAESADRLVSFKLIAVLDLQAGAGRRLEQRVLGRQDCAASAAP